MREQNWCRSCRKNDQTVLLAFCLFVLFYCVRMFKVPVHGLITFLYRCTIYEARTPVIEIRTLHIVVNSIYCMYCMYIIHVHDCITEMSLLHRIEYVYGKKAKTKLFKSLSALKCM